MPVTKQAFRKNSIKGGRGVKWGNQVKRLTRTLVKDRPHFSLKTANNFIVVLDVFLTSSFIIPLKSNATEIVFSFQKIYK